MKSPVSKQAKRLYSIAFALLVIECASMCLVGDLSAQWTAVAPSLLGKQDFGMGSIVHRGGLTWAGSHDVWMSPDSGTTWINRTIGKLGNDYIDDINFFDRSSGIVCTHNGNMFITHDQGLSWNRYQVNGGSANSAAFLGNSTTILVATGAGNTIDVSADGGATWAKTNIGTFVTSVRPLIGGSALALGVDQPNGRRIYKTTDYGMTWQQQTGRIDFDTWSCDVNPCEPSVLYAVNEEGNTFVVDDGKPAIYRSLDGGANWQIVEQQSSRPYYSGSIAIASPAVFAQTVSTGIIRSTDQGNTWQRIGGPSATFDTRLVCPINANIILAADNAGTIWRTITSGGDSISNVKPLAGLSIQPELLFSTDTLLNCDSPIVQTVYFSLQLCSYPKIVGQYIRGADSLDYKIVSGLQDSLSSGDSARISFHPRSSGDQNGEYVIILEDGTQIAVALAGYGRDIVFVEPTSASVALDTIGDDASVPIMINGLPQLETVEMVVHYDPKLIYNGAFASDGTPLDIPAENWAGRTKLHLDASKLRLDTASGELRFTVFPDGDTCFHVTIDSLSILNPKAPCLYSIGSGSPQTVCPPRGCGVMTVNNFLRYQRSPQFSLAPNPAHTLLQVRSNSASGENAIDILDSRGSLVFTTHAIIAYGLNTIRLPQLVSGRYWITFREGGGLRSFPFVVLN